MVNEPLGLPKGSVRAIISIALVATSIAGLFLRPEASDKIVPVLTAVLAYYFGNRSEFGTGGGQ